MVDQLALVSLSIPLIECTAGVACNRCIGVGSELRQSGKGAILAASCAKFIGGDAAHLDAWIMQRKIDQCYRQVACLRQRRKLAGFAVLTPVYKIPLANYD